MYEAIPYILFAIQCFGSDCQSLDPQFGYVDSTQQRIDLRIVWLSVVQIQWTSHSSPSLCCVACWYSSQFLRWPLIHTLQGFKVVVVLFWYLIIKLSFTSNTKCFLFYRQAVRGQTTGQSLTASTDIRIVGDDLLVTNPKRIKIGIEKKRSCTFYNFSCCFAAFFDGL